VPAVVGEILAGIVIGRTGFGVLDTSDPTLVFLADVGFAMLMFEVGMNVPLHDRSIRASLGRGAGAAAIVALLAVGGGAAVSTIPGVGHPAIYAVLLASCSAAVVVPIIQERGITGRSVLTVIAQVTVADVAATIAIPFVLRPSRAAEVALGTLLVVASAIALLFAGRALRRLPQVRALRQEGKRRRWAIDLRISLIILFALAWVAERTNASILIAGFGVGLVVAAIGGPKRLSTEVLGIGGGFFVPLFFVVLGARIDLRGIVTHPAMLGLTAALVALTAVVHVLGAVATGQRASAGLLASAQLGVPAAIVALGVPAGVITATEGAAIVAASVLSLAVSATGAAWFAGRRPR
jgi:Kef-type K+ transport system membrane component KefB